MWFGFYDVGSYTQITIVDIATSGFVVSSHCNYRALGARCGYLMLVGVGVRQVCGEAPLVG